MCIYKCFNNMYVLLYHYMVAPMLATGPGTDPGSLEMSHYVNGTFVNLLV